MLDSATPFPLVGSYALYEADGRTWLARILLRDLDGNATIQMPARFGASGTKTIPASDLIDGTPLTEDERLEETRLFSRLLGVKRPRGKAHRRFTELRTRGIHSRILKELMDATPLRRVA